LLLLPKFCLGLIAADFYNIILIVDIPRLLAQKMSAGTLALIQEVRFVATYNGMVGSAPEHERDVVKARRVVWLINAYGGMRKFGLNSASGLTNSTPSTLKIRRCQPEDPDFHKALSILLSAGYEFCD
jgi:hypothetical protein